MFAFLSDRNHKSNRVHKIKLIFHFSLKKTEIAKQLETEKQRNLFNSKDYVFDTLQAEHLYNQNNHFTLSVFITETRHTALLPNFEKEDTFRFEKSDVQGLMDMLGESR